ncbi:MAG TPA: RNA 2',3'-cyclic phosphodiesterase [Paludibacter sp.]|nr:RNA 2',3'-cyclic phosphodiesterase [Paludibacter sp.]
MEKKRVFLAFAIKLDRPLADKIKQLQNKFSANLIKWVSTDNFHVTLFFFGELTAEQIDALQKLLHEALNNSTTFSFSVTGPGIFRNRKDPRVLWLDIEASSQLINLKNQINNTVIPLGFTSNDKRFHPHLTLGRFLPRQKNSSLLDNLLNEWQSTEQLEYTVRELVLFESKQTQTGVRYYPIDVFSLIPQ